MNIAELVFAALTDGSDGLRAHHDVLPRETDMARILPIVTITTVSEDEEVGLLDSDLEPTLCRRRVQLDAWATSRKAADDYAKRASVKMKAATTFSVGARQHSGAPGYDDEANLYRASFDYAIWYEDAP